MAVLVLLLLRYQYRRSRAEKPSTCWRADGPLAGYRLSVTPPSGECGNPAPGATSAERNRGQYVAGSSFAADFFNAGGRSPVIR
ncbi:hypothetical protein KCP73_14490 [Salmonella enterica subsp. enterica]|nr:hypothetical protein KCP73_14490 [Salmonella enterica subsp. enterica]